MRFPLRCAAALLALPALASPLFGWSAAGHTITGWLADRHLAGSRAEQEVKQLLRPGETLERMSVWADTIKSGPFDADSKEYLEKNPDHAQYHYVNLPFQLTAYAPDAIGARPDDLVQIYARCIKVLKGKATAEENPTGLTPRLALLILAHCAGDLAQPFHVGSSYIADVGGKQEFIDPTGWTGGTFHDDWGGNGLKVGPGNLHFLWDLGFVEKGMQRVSGGTNPQVYAAWLQRTHPPQSSWRGTGEPETWPAQWATEILPLARAAHEGIRLGPRRELPPRRNSKPGEPPKSEWDAQLPANYDQRAIEIIHPQLAKGGWRLAEVLKAIWPDPPPAEKPVASEAEAQQRALKKHPALGERGSALNAEFVARHNRYRKEKPAFFKDKAWPLTLAEEAAAALPSPSSVPAGSAK